MLVELGLLALTSSATPSGDPDGSAESKRSGIEFRLDAGLSWNRYASKNGPHVYSILGGPTVTLGWRFSSGLALGAGIALQVGPAYRFTDYYLEQNNALVIWPRLFAQVDYHLQNGGLHLGVAAGVGNLDSTSDQCDCYNVSGALNGAGPGFVVAPQFGYDWPARKAWGFGALGRLWLSPTDRYGETGFIVAPELAFSARWF